GPRTIPRLPRLARCNRRWISLPHAIFISHLRVTEKLGEVAQAADERIETAATNIDTQVQTRPGFDAKDIRVVVLAILLKFDRYTKERRRERDDLVGDAVIETAPGVHIAIFWIVSRLRDEFEDAVCKRAIDCRESYPEIGELDLHDVR